MPSENRDLATKVPLPLEPFFLALSDKDLHITITDWERLHRALACRGNWTLRRLRNVLTALLAKNEEQTIIVERDALTAISDLWRIVSRQIMIP